MRITSAFHPISYQTPYNNTKPLHLQRYHYFRKLNSIHLSNTNQDSFHNVAVSLSSLFRNTYKI